MEEDIKNIRDIQEMLGVFDNITQDQLDEAIRKADKEWSEMELNEDIKVLEEFLKENKEILERIDDYKNIDIYAFPIAYKEVQAIENLIKRNKELEEKANRLGKLYYEANENCIKYEKDYILKSKVREKIEELENEDLVIHDDRDSEDVIFAKYEQIAVLDFCEELLQEGDK